MRKHKIKYKIKEVLPKVFCVFFEDNFDMSMTFMRAQEFYESSNKDFRGKTFTLIEHMRYYSKKFGKGSYTYTNDYVGFNLPSSVLYDTRFVYSDRNDYDVEREQITFTIEEKLKSKELEPDFYLIAVMNDNKQETKRGLIHEMAHGLFYTNHLYRQEMVKLIAERVDDKTYSKFRKILLKHGYGPNVILDEMQAYLSTGLIDDMKALNISENTKRKFRKTFRKYEKVSKTK